MSNIPIRDIPGSIGTPTEDALVAMDNGVTMQKTTARAIAEAGRPAASKAEAEAGEDNRKVMTPLRVAEAIAAQSISPTEVQAVYDARDATLNAADAAAGSAGTAVGAAGTAQTSAGQAMAFRNAAEAFSTNANDAADRAETAAQDVEGVGIVVANLPAILDAPAQAAAAAGAATVAGTQANRAEGQADRAEGQADRAELAADNAFVNANVYADVATGRAAVADGEQFQVLVDEEYVRYRRDSSSTQTEVGRYPSAGYVAQIEATTEKLVATSKNLFDPSAIITGFMYRDDGTKRSNASYRVTPKYPVVAGQKVAISGMGATLLSGTPDRHLNFWDGDTHVTADPFPSSNANMDWMVVTAPEGATSFSVNLPSATNPLPQKLQIEIAPSPTDYEPRWKTQTALPEVQFDNLHFVQSAKNIFDGRVFTNRIVSENHYSVSGNIDTVSSGFIPVQVGKTYTISGLRPQLVELGQRVVAGFSRPKNLPTPTVEDFGRYTGDTFTFTVANPETEFVAFIVARSPLHYQQAFDLNIQVEEGPTATPFEPYRLVRGSEKQIEAVENRLRAYIDEAGGGGGGAGTTAWTSFDQLDQAGPGVTYVKPTRIYGPCGAGYYQGAGGDADGSILYARMEGLPSGEMTISALLACYDSDGASTLPRISVSPFDVPSGQLIYDPPAAGVSVDSYVHPSIAYDATGVGGYKYWMVASILTGYSTPGDATWEDEDIFVSNDAQTWLRVKSLYEHAQSHHAPGLSLPPHNLTDINGRRFGFLPIPGAGDTIEISTPASSIGPALDRVNITLVGSPWKHDPAILIDGGYVYIYHSYHLRYEDHPGGNNRFIVCTRTSDGVNWECVRSDGSTMPLDTPEASRQMFTKDDQGRFNYLHFPAAGAFSNPEVVKYGENDFEFVYGGNFSRRYAGTSPWNFDFETTLPMQDLGSGNHPGLLQNGGVLYLLNQTGLFRSEDRGVSFVQQAHYPVWRGGSFGLMYKKALCVGEGGRVIVVDTYSMRFSAVRPGSVGQYVSTMRRNKIFLQEFPSVSAFVEAGTDGLGDGYIDVQIDQVNSTNGTRRSIFVPYVGNTATTGGVNDPHQTVPVVTLNVEAGDVFHTYISLNSRAGGAVSFNGLSIE